MSKAFKRLDFKLGSGCTSCMLLTDCVVSALLAELHAEEPGCVLWSQARSDATASVDEEKSGLRLPLS